MPQPFLEATLAGDAEAAAAAWNVDFPPEWWDEFELVKLRLDDLRRDPAYLPWSIRGIVLRQSNLMVGHCGFHSVPNAAYLRRWGDSFVEMGYTIFPEYRRRGYGTEAVRQMMRWAGDEHGVRRFVLSILSSNAASAALARKLGFTRVGEWLDPVEGLRDVYLLELLQNDEATGIRNVN